MWSIPDICNAKKYGGLQMGVGTVFLDNTSRMPLGLMLFMQGEI